MNEKVSTEETRRQSGQNFSKIQKKLQWLGSKKYHRHGIYD